jgi:DNA-binding CsgD family transcriptional regulator
MKQLTLKDTQQLLKSVQDLYSLKNLDTFGQDSLAILEQLAPTEASVLINQKFDLTERDRLILAIRLVIARPGEQYLLFLAEEQVMSWLNVLELLGLSHREAEILACILQGQDNKAIAVQLSIHVSTVRKHLENIYHKLDVQSRTEAIALALEKSGCLQLHPLI